MLRPHPLRTLLRLPQIHRAQRKLSSTAALRNTSSREPFDPNAVERVSDDVDVCIVGGGPAGLSAAIRLKQLEQEKGREIRVVVLEKGAEIGMSLDIYCYVDFILLMVVIS